MKCIKRYLSRVQKRKTDRGEIEESMLGKGNERIKESHQSC